MKSENSSGKFLLGIGLGVLAGVAVSYLMNGENRRKLEQDFNEVGHGIKDGVKSAFTKVKSKMEHAGSESADKVGKWSEKAGDKAEEWSEKAGNKAEEWSDKVGNKAEKWADEAGNKASGAADNLSQKANDFRQKMESNYGKDSDAHNKYGQSYRQDVNSLKDKTKSEKNDTNATTGTTI